MEFYMLVLALDTTTRRGSAALARDAAVVDCEVGDARLTHGERLPADVIRLLDIEDFNEASEMSASFLTSSARKKKKTGQT